jgi:DNA-binding protein H-NS
MSNLIDLQSQIEKLQKQAAELKSKEFASTVADIRAKMAAYGITVKDLGGKSGSKSGAKGKPGRPAKAGKVAKVTKVRKSKVAGVPVAAKFKGPNGESWSGRGLQPKWLSALVAQGASKSDFAV